LVPFQLSPPHPQTRKSPPAGTANNRQSQNVLGRYIERESVEFCVRRFEWTDGTTKTTTRSERGIEILEIGIVMCSDNKFKRCLGYHEQRSRLLWAQLCLPPVPSLSLVPVSPPRTSPTLGCIPLMPPHLVLPIPGFAPYRVLVVIWRATFSVYFVRKEHFRRWWTPAFPPPGKSRRIALMRQHRRHRLIIPVSPPPTIIGVGDLSW